MHRRDSHAYPAPAVLCLLAFLGACRLTEPLGSRRVTGPWPAGLCELRAVGLPASPLRLHVSGDRVLAESRAGRWTGRSTVEPHDPNTLRLHIARRADGTQHRLILWCRRPTDANLPRPLFADQRVCDDRTNSEHRHQSLEITLSHGAQRAAASPDATARWVLEHLDSVHDPKLLDACADHLFHAPADASASYAGVVACLERALALDPQGTERYTLCAWLLWSDWVTWTQDPNRAPGAEHNVERALRLLATGSELNPADAAYHLDAANTLAPLARHHRPELEPLVIRYYRRAAHLTRDPTARGRIRTLIGNRYRLDNQPAAARRWYRTALSLNPADSVARRYLDRLGKS